MQLVSYSSIIGPQHARSPVLLLGTWHISSINVSPIQYQCFPNNLMRQHSKNSRIIILGWEKEVEVQLNTEFLISFFWHLYCVTFEV